VYHDTESYRLLCTHLLKVTDMRTKSNSSSTHFQASVLVMDNLAALCFGCQCTSHDLLSCVTTGMGASNIKLADRFDM